MKKWKPKTYRQWRTEKPAWFKDAGFDPGIEALCDDWYMYRRLCDTDEKFEYFFKRDITNLYPRYIEQVTTQNLYLQHKIDWFVSNYSESWNYIKNATNSTTTNDASTDTTQNLTDASKSTLSSSGQEGTTFSETGDDTSRTGHTGTQSTKRTDDLITTIKNTGTQTSTGTSSGETTGETTSTGSASQHAEQDDNSTSDARHLETSLPMSQQVAGGDFEGHFVGGWQTGSAKSQDKTTTTANSNSTSSNQTDAVSTSSGTSSGQTSSKRTDNLTQTNTNTGTVSNLRTDDLLDDHEGDYRKHGENSKTSSSKSSTDSTLTKTGTTGVKAKGKVDVEGGGETTNLSITTGRTGLEPAKVIEEALRVIRSMNAWEWLKNKLDEDFWLLFDEEDEEYGIQ